MAQGLPPGFPGAPPPGGFQNIDIGFGPLDTKTDPAMLPVGALTTAENVSTQSGGVYQTRNGYTALAAGPSACRRVFTLGDEIDAIDDSFTDVTASGRGASVLWRYQSAIAAWNVAGVGRISEISIVDTTRKEIARDQTQDLTCAGTGGNATIAVHAWLDNTGALSWRSESVSDGSILSTSSIIGSHWNILRVVTVGGTAAILVASTFNQQVGALAISLTTGLATVSLTILASAANVSATNAVVDGVASNSTDLVIAWTTNTPSIKVARYTASSLALLAGPTAISTETCDTCLGVIATAGEIGVIAYHSTVSGGLRGALFNPSTMAQTVAPFLIQGITAPVANNVGFVRMNSTNVLAVWDRIANGPTKGKLTWANIASSGSVQLSLVTLRNHVMASKPWTYLGSVFCNLAYYSDGLLISQSTYFCVRIDPAPLNITDQACVVQAVQAYRNVGYSLNAGHGLIGSASDVNTVSPGVFRWAGTTSYKYTSATSIRLAITNFVLDFTRAAACLPVEVLGTAMLPSAATASYDGSNPNETGFLLYPEIVLFGVGGGGTIANGTYNYIAIFEWSDARGNTYSSTTSSPVSVTVAGGGGTASVVLTIEDYVLARQGFSGKCQISVYRTTAGGTNYFLATTSPVDGSLSSHIITDRASDSAITLNRALYTAGGVLDMEPPIPCRHMVLHQNRIYGISSEDPKVIFYSGDIVQGIGPWFSSIQQFRIDAGGDIIALASLDDKLVAFKKDRVFKIYGRGCNALGQNNDLSLPQIVSSDCGCIEPRSVVRSQEGVYFQSAKGLHLLNRAEQVIFVGANVQGYTDAFATCSSAVLMPDRREVRFGFRDNVSGTITIPSLDLVWNYDAQRWTTHRKYGDQLTHSAAATISDRYVWATSNGNVYQERTDGLFTDPGNTFISWTLETGWIRPAGPQGMSRVQRVLFLGESATTGTGPDTGGGDHGLTISVAKDYDMVAGYSQTWSFTSAQIEALSKEQLSVHLTDQKGEAFRVLIQTTAGNTPMAGTPVTAVGLLLKSKPIRNGTAERYMPAAAKK